MSHKTKYENRPTEIKQSEMQPKTQKNVMGKKMKPLPKIIWKLIV